MPDPELGEKACAYILKKSGADLNFEMIIEYLKTKNASVLQPPERIEFIDVMPLTKAKKLDKGALDEDIRKKMGMRKNDSFRANLSSGKGGDKR